MTRTFQGFKARNKCFSVYHSDSRTLITSVAAPTKVRASGLPDGLKRRKNGYLKRGDALIFEGIEAATKIGIVASEGTNGNGIKSKNDNCILIKQVASYQQWRGYISS